MGKLLCALFSIAFIFISCEESPNETILLHNGWQFSETEKIHWQPATVPGTVQADLLLLGQIPNLFLKDNEDSIQWVSTKNWMYKKRFSVAPEILKLKKHYLHFEGLDTYAEVFLNDSLLFLANNAFREWEVEVGKALKPENELLIIFKSPDSIEINEAEKIGYKLSGGNRVFTRRPQYQYGWDWSPTIKTMGIWRNISLTSFDLARMKDVFFQTRSISATEAEMLATFILETAEDEEFIVKITNVATSESVASTFKNTSEDKLLQIPFKIKNPKLWWTHNLGAPFLYEFKVELLHNNDMLQTISKKIGVRTIKLVTEKDSMGESFYFKLNGKPVYMKGANYIPQQVFQPQIDSIKYEKLIADAAKANMNMLRVWGGGIYEDDYFYQLCDEKGILVWQDFMFACAMYPGDAAFLENVKQEAIENIKRLRNHPSIALWCGNNENSEGWQRWGWQNDKTETQKQKIWEGYYAVFNHILPRVVDSLSPKSSYWESSPKYGRGDKRYQFEGDAHDWWVWHDGYPFEHFEEIVPRFMSEFGFQSFPGVETVQYAVGKDSILLGDPLFANHQKHGRGFQIIEEYMGRDFPIPQQAEDYIYMSQLLQAYGITKGIHAQRRAKPYNMGTLYWQLNDCWPAVSWASIDYSGRWKALHYQAKKAFENVLVSAVESKGSAQIFVVNDTFEKISGTLSVALMDFDGRVISKKNLFAECLANSSEIVYTLPLDTLNFDRRRSLLRINFWESEYIFYFAKPKELKLKMAEINIETSSNEKGFSIKLMTKTLQKNVFLRADETGTFSDNFFDLLPNESKTIQFKTEAKPAPTISFKTLNQFIKQ